jgi:hypothetical protein
VEVLTRAEKLKQAMDFHSGTVVETDILADGLLKTDPKNHNLAQWDVVIG